MCYYLAWKDSAGKTKVHSASFKFFGSEKVRPVSMPYTTTLATGTVGGHVGNYLRAARQVALVLVLGISYRDGCDSVKAYDLGN